MTRTPIFLLVLATSLMSKATMADDGCCGRDEVVSAFSQSDSTDGSQPATKIKVVDRVTDSSASFLKLPFPGGEQKLIAVRATGELTFGVAKSARLSPVIYVRPPADGFQAFVFAAEADGEAEPSEVSASFVWPNPPDWVRGVRIIADENSLQCPIDEAHTLMVADIEAAASDGVDFHVRFNETTSEYCVVGELEVRLGKYKETWKFGRLCIAKNAACIEGSKNLTRYVKVKWKLCVEGNKVVLKAKGCERIFGNCTRWYSTSLSIE